MATTIYLIGSLRNPEVPKIGNALRALGFDAFDDWFAAGPTADDSWQEYENQRGRSYQEALEGHAARNVFAFDHRHLERADAGVLIMPAGKSGHSEFGFLVGRGKPCFVLFDKTPERYDVMYQFAHLNGATVFLSVDSMLAYFKKGFPNDRPTQMGPTIS